MLTANKHFARDRDLGFSKPRSQFSQEGKSSHSYTRLLSARNGIESIDRCPPGALCATGHCAGGVRASQSGL